MRTYRVTSTHAEDFGNGQLVEPGQEGTVEEVTDRISQLENEGKIVFRSEEVPDPPPLTEAAAKLADAEGIDPRSIERTAKGNQITVDEVKAAVAARDEASNNDEEETP